MRRGWRALRGMVVGLRSRKTSSRTRHPSADWRSEGKEEGKGEVEICPINILRDVRDCRHSSSRVNTVRKWLHALRDFFIACGNFHDTSILHPRALLLALYDGK